MLKNQIGIDRMVLSGFRILSIDEVKVRGHQNVEYEPCGEALYRMSNGKGFRFLKIKDNQCFGTLIAGSRQIGCCRRDYTRIDLFIQNGPQGNLQNSSVTAYKHRFLDVLQYILYEYGIEINPQLTKLNTLEINCNIALDEEFYKYHRPLRLIMCILPKQYRNKLAEYSRIEDNASIKSETFFRGNASIELKIYDKKEHLRQKTGISPPDNLMRIEFVLKKSAKIKTVFGSNYLADLTDTKINEFFMKQFSKVIENRYRRWQIDNEKDLSARVKMHKDQNPRYWKSNLLNECADIEQKNKIPVLLDVSDLYPIIKAQDKNGHYRRELQTFQNYRSYRETFYQKDSVKVNEIIEKVHEVYDAFIYGLEPESSPSCLFTA